MRKFKFNASTKNLAVNSLSQIDRRMKYLFYTITCDLVIQCFQNKKLNTSDLLMKKKIVAFVNSGSTELQTTTGCHRWYNKNNLAASEKVWKFELMWSISFFFVITYSVWRFLLGFYITPMHSYLLQPILIENYCQYFW